MAVVATSRRTLPMDLPTRAAFAGCIRYLRRELEETVTELARCRELGAYGAVKLLTGRRDGVTLAIATVRGALAEAREGA